MTEVGNRDIPPLNWDVLVTPGIPIATSDLPPGTNQVMFQAIASTLIYGKQDAVLVDAFMTVKQADSLADSVVQWHRNHLMRQPLLRNLAIRLANSYQHGIRFRRVIL
jgi:hypothetical protein